MLPALAGLLPAVAGILLTICAAQAETTLLNASYDPTRRFYSVLNRAFASRWLAETGDKVTVYQSRLAEAPARQQRALHVDHRVPGAQGQPQADSRLA
jgi:ABC-type sulfate transport system substrate-binding protein